MPESFVASHGSGVVVENHLNMIRATVPDSQQHQFAVIAAVLNSRAADAAFRWSAAQWRYPPSSLEELPLPSPATMRKIVALLLTAGANRSDRDRQSPQPMGTANVVAAA